MSRLPIRAKLTLAFAAAMALVLVGAGSTLLGRFDKQLDRTVTTDLRIRSRDVAAAVTQSRRTRTPLAVQDDAGGLVQVLDLRNHVLAASPRLGGRSVLTGGELRTAADQELLLRRGPGAGILLLARPAGPDRVVALGTSLQPHTRAREALIHVLVLAGPAVLLLAVALGYGVAFFALRPVEAMRRRAAAVTAGATGQRLPVPPARDELAALGRTLNDMIARLEQALDRERTLVADASHELRTPLAIAQAEVELALRGDAAREETEEALRSIGEEVERLVRLADDLLVLARADRWELPLERRRIGVAQLLRHVGERARRTCGDGVVVTTGPAPQVDVDADPQRVEQALSNLVVNSVRYGGSRVRLWAEDEAGGAVVLHVSDDGPGFDDDFLPRAFSRFARGAEARTTGGAGLGLAIVAAIASAHGGDAGARNLQPTGADVWIRLPGSVSRPESDGRPARGAPAPGAPRWQS